LLAIAEVVGGVSDLTEAMRLVCRELVRLTGADTAVAHLLDREAKRASSRRGYHLPKPLVPCRPGRVRAAVLAAIVEAATSCGATTSPTTSGSRASSRARCRTRSGVVRPLVADGERRRHVLSAWWDGAPAVAASEAVMLRTIGRQVAARPDARSSRTPSAAAASSARSASARSSLASSGNNLSDGVIYQVIRRPDGSPLRAELANAAAHEINNPWPSSSASSR